MMQWAKLNQGFSSFQQNFGPLETEKNKLLKSERLKKKDMQMDERLVEWKRLASGQSNRTLRNEGGRRRPTPECICDLVSVER